MVALAAGLVACGASAVASDIDWIGAFGGSFQDPKNWSFGFTPRTFDLARFGYRPGPYTAFVDNLTTVGSFDIYRGDITISLQGQTLSMLDGDSLAPPGIRVADGAGEIATLTLVGGGRFAGVNMAVARGAGADATLRLTGGARVTANGVLTMGGGGVARVAIDGGARLAANSSSLAAGSVVSGNGTVITALTCAGALSPGADASIGTLTVQGACAYAAPGSLLIDLAPAAGDVGPRADALHVTGALSLAGTLRVSMLAGYTPAAGDSFTIVTAGSLTGAFDSVDAPGLADSFSLALSYSATGVTLTVVPAPGGAVVVAGALALGRRRRL